MEVRFAVMQRKSDGAEDVRLGMRASTLIEVEEERAVGKDVGVGKCERG